MTSETRIIQTASLLTNYTRMAPVSPTVPPMEGASREQVGAGWRFWILAGTLCRQRVPGTRTTKIEWDVTPALAEALLKRKLGSRVPSLAVVAAYARDVSAGKWQPSPQGLGVGPLWELGDGVHRCLAIVRSGVTVRMMVTWYHEQSDFDLARHTWDTGPLRARGNVLELAGLVPRGQGGHAAALLRAVACLDGRYPEQPTDEQLVCMYGQVRLSAEAVAGMAPSTFLAATRAAFLIAHRKAPIEVEACMRVVMTNAGALPGSAAHSLAVVLPRWQRAWGRRDCAGLMNNVLNLLYAHVKQEPGTTAVVRVEEARHFFLGEHYRAGAGR